MRGVLFGILSSCCVSLNSIFTKKVLPAVDDSVWTLNYYNNLNASLLFLPLMFIFGELPQTVFVTQMTEPMFWLLMCLGGVMGVLIGFVTGMQIKVRINSLLNVIWHIYLTFIQSLDFIYIGIFTMLNFFQATSPLTHNISGTAKACVQTVIAVRVYEEIKSWTWWASNWIVLLGSAAYTKVQQMEMEAEFNKKRTVLPT